MEMREFVIANKKSAQRADFLEAAILVVAAFPAEFAPAIRLRLAASREFSRRSPSG